ncbi:MAG: hypothetical protein A3K19_04265 [Lentisphaerae bacterium RIFOXYB12_FULL_65_16]|nr:MAG: hypothetical protein A3K18_09430 [Lentisphaerae bacterium RIFOXYA12_64_32]OGV84298.1 MAG: hypothetical protein A3K19_04265 [Lentisphaerae bacterium RIFOXYB12_FULL_65_16]
MQRRVCPITGFELPVLGIGCWSFGGGAYWGAQDRKDEANVVREAIARDCNYLDTAEVYNSGASEEALGATVRTCRGDVILGTKVPPSACHPPALRAHCDASLRRLATDAIDLYMVHWPLTRQAIKPFTQDETILASPPNVTETFATLLQLQKQGKIRQIGVCNFGVKQLGEALATGAKIAVNQLFYSILARAIEFDILPLCARHGVGVMAYMPLLQGLLTGKYHSADELPFARARIRHFRGDRKDSRHEGPGFETDVFAALDGLRGIAARADVPLTHLALGWVAAQPGVVCVLAGARTGAQVAENAAAFARPLPAETLVEAEALTRPLRDAMGTNADYFESAKNSRIE